LIVSVKYVRRNQKQADAKDDVARYESVPELERGGFRIQWSRHFENEGSMETLLREEPRTLLVTYTEGQWYSNGEAGPDYYQYYVGCRKEDTGSLIDDFERRVREKLGHKAWIEITIEEC